MASGTDSHLNLRGSEELTLKTVSAVGLRGHEENQHLNSLRYLLFKSQNLSDSGWCILGCCSITLFPVEHMTLLSRTLLSSWEGKIIKKRIIGNVISREQME